MLSPYFQLLVTFQNNSPQASSFASLIPALGEARGSVGEGHAERLSGGRGGQGQSPAPPGKECQALFPLLFLFFLLPAPLIFFVLLQGTSCPRSPGRWPGVGSFRMKRGQKIQHDRRPGALPGCLGFRV